MKVSVLGAQQQAFVNQQHQKQKLDGNEPNNQSKLKSIALINAGDEHSHEQAEQLFKRANEYASLTMQAQRMLSGYESVVLSERKESIRQMLGVDLYA